MADSQNFCRHCGQTLAANSRFCAACGTRVPGRNQEEVEQEKKMVRDAAATQLRWASNLMLIYSIPFLIAGLYVLLSIDSLVDMMMNDATVRDYLDYYGLTSDDLYSYFEYAGYAYIVSSICGLGSAILCRKRTKYWAAAGLCIVSVLLGVAGFLALFLGLIAFWMIISGRMCFIEHEAELESILDNIE